MAMACFVERAPCLPSRIWSISWRTNSPACVDGDFPSRLSCSARSAASRSGITTPRHGDPIVAMPLCSSGRPSAVGTALLELIPQILVVDLVVILHLRRFDDRAEEPRATVGRALLEIGIPTLHIGAEQL